MWTLLFFIYLEASSAERLGVTECAAFRGSPFLEPLSQTFMWSWPVEPLSESLAWILFFGNLENQNVEPFGTCNILSVETIIGILGKPEPIYCAEPLNLLSVVTFCGTILWRNL